MNASQQLTDVPPGRIPGHVAIIMDGNGRWAVQRGLERVHGHQQGAEVVKDLVTLCTDLLRDHGGPSHLTLYSFSLENWKRPVQEVGFLMQMYVDYLRAERPTMVERNIRFRQLGRLDSLPEPVLDEVQETLDVTKDNDGLTLSLALNYGSRAEITDAVRQLAREVADGSINPDAIQESHIADRLYTAGMPDPDLLIRTAGEMRISNYLLWQISYAELHVSQKLWPDFDEGDFIAAMRDYASRNRRFGALDRSNTLTPQ